MIKHFIIGVLSVLSVISCNTKKPDRAVSFLSKNDSLPSSVPNLINPSLEELLSINLNKIKNQGRKYTTSTVVANEQSKKYYRPSIEGFYGSYTLFFENGVKQPTYIGYLVVFNDKKEWLYEDTEDYLIEIYVEEDDIVIDEELKVGTHISDFIKTFGEPITLDKQHCIFKLSEGAYLSVRLSDNFAVAIKAGKYDLSIKEDSIITYLCNE